MKNKTKNTTMSEQF